MVVHHPLTIASVKGHTSSPSTLEKITLTHLFLMMKGGPMGIPVPYGDTDIDLEDEVFWTSWMADIRADEYHFTESV